MQFIKATKEQAKLRLALFGPSGSGKTFTALRMATGLGGEIALIDTERGSASMYADRFAFDVLELPKTDIATYVAGIAAASAYDVLIIDSLSHAWFALLDEVEKLAKTKYKGNTWSAWSEGTPKQRAMVDALLGFDGHIIATMRVKTEWTVETTSRGKTRPVYVGLAPQQGKGIEYEFDLLMQLTQEHIATVLKDRTGKFQDQIIDKPGEDFGKSLAEWLKEGATPKRKRKTATAPPAEAEAVKPEADFDPANLANFTEMTAAAVERLGYNHPAHVLAALKVITGGDSNGLSYEDMWAMLADHQAAKEDGDTELPKDEGYDDIPF